MAQTLIRFDTPVTYRDGRQYRAQACGRERENGQWEAWLEFEDIDIRRGPAVAARNDAAQSEGCRLLGHRPDAGVSGRCARSHSASAEAQRGLHRVRPPLFDGPAPHRRARASPNREPILDPFSVYDKSPDLLAQELTALRGWHLRQIIRDFELVDETRCAARGADRARARIAHHAARPRATPVAGRSGAGRAQGGRPCARSPRARPAWRDASETRPPVLAFALRPARAP